MILFLWSANLMLCSSCSWQVLCKPHLFMIAACTTLHETHGSRQHDREVPFIIFPRPTHRLPLHYSTLQDWNQASTATVFPRFTCSSLTELPVKTEPVSLPLTAELVVLSGLPNGPEINKGSAELIDAPGSAPILLPMMRVEADKCERDVSS